MNETGGSSAEEPTRPETGAAFDSVVRKLVRLLLDVRVACDAMEASLESPDAMNLENAANDLTSCWRTAQRTLQTLESRADEVRTNVRQAHAALEERRPILAELFRRALVHIADSAAHERLDKLFAELGPMGDRAPGRDGDRPPSPVVPNPEAEESSAR